MYDFQVFNAEICDLPSDAEENVTMSEESKSSPLSECGNSQCSVFDADSLQSPEKKSMSVILSMNQRLRTLVHQKKKSIFLKKLEESLLVVKEE